MNWNYRLVKHTHPDYPEDTWYGVHEVYYDYEGNIDGVTENPITIGADTATEVHSVLKTILGDIFKYEVLNWEDIVKEE